MNAATTVPHGGVHAVAGYLAEIDARLPGPRRPRRRVIAELRDGLATATAEYVVAGLPAQQAADAAIAQFGSPRVVADAFAAELATAYARRTIARYVLTGPLVGIWWLLLLHPQPWRTGPIALLAAIPVLPLIVIAIAAAGATLAATGRLMRWVPESGPVAALTAAQIIAWLCTAVDLTMIGLFVASARPMHPVAVAAVAASLIRTGCGVTVIYRTALMRRRCHG
jgi:hypothetical protein